MEMHMNNQQARARFEGLGIQALPQPSEKTPAVNPDYVFRADMANEMAGFWLMGAPAMKLVGHKGCGKTTIVEQFHAALNYPLVKITAHPRMEASSLLSQFVPVATGGFAHRYGPLALAAKHGCSVLIDEYNLLDPGEAASLNNILERGMFEIVETGEVIRPAEGFRVFVACNPNDKAAGYFGRNDQDSSNDDRFWTVFVEYPSASEEIPIVEKILGAIFDETTAKSYAENMVSVANKVRKQFMGVSQDNSALELTMSTRTLINWAQGFTIFSDAPSPLHFALERALTNQKHGSATKVAIHEIVADVTGEAYPTKA
jgi:cobaltochelatase CobS